MRTFAVSRLLLAGLVACLALTCAGQLYAREKGSPPSKQDLEQAAKHMEAGVRLHNDPDGPRDEEAYAEFKKAYELSDSPNALRNMAICAQSIELDGEAIELYQKFLEITKDDEKIREEDKEQVRKDLQALSAVVSWVTLHTDKVGTTFTDVRTPRKGSQVTNVYKGSISGIRLGIHPGQHTFTASVEGSPDKVWKVDIKNGSKHSHSFNFETGAVTAEGFTEDDQRGLTGEDTEEDEGGGVPAYPFVALGITVAVAVPWVIFMVSSNNQKADYEAASEADKPALADDLNTTNTLADVFMAITLTGVVTTIILFATADYGPDDDDKNVVSKGPRFGVDYTIAPAIDPNGGGGAQLSVRF